MSPTKRAELDYEIFRKCIRVEHMARKVEHRMASRVVAAFLVLGLAAACGVVYFFVGAL